MKRRHQVVLFAVLLLSLTILSPSFDFRGSQHNQGRNQEKDTYTGVSSRNEDTRAPLDVMVSMSAEEFASFQKVAKEVATSIYVEVNLRNVEPKEYKEVLDQEFSLGENGDIILLDSDQVQHYARKGYLVPLNATALSKALGDSVAELRGMTEWNGYQWAMPFDLDPYVMGVTASYLNEAGLQDFPQNREQWSKLIKASQTKSTPLISLNIDDIYGVGAWLSYLPPGMAPDQILKMQLIPITNESQQGVGLLRELQPYIMTMSADPVLSASEYKVPTPMFVSTLSRILHADEAAKGRGTFTSPVSLQALQAVESRSMVITAGTVETDAASRWIEGMSSAVTQTKWYKQTNRLPARQQENKKEVGDVESRYNMASNQSWLAKESPMQAIENKTMIDRFRKRVQQLLEGEISAAQYVSSIRKTVNP
ncbi:extracellular solute-binding protein [Paenibacillus polysaccharolyticus]|uniref:extracellular solute-binding protein n=1 Tax=Paenibacillus polysaccharolyticus TaxID=582692 RepID=UPI00203DF447|nr:extracellular solute-binding protein [Paenibacillus polysaccharolyticus]MCM3133841.1 extracellular solute-binding protein [Paenibacillus polysaccharolyticus]